MRPSSSSAVPTLKLYSDRTIQVLENTTGNYSGALTLEAEDDAVNHLKITALPTGDGPIISADGDDADASIFIEPKGGGSTKAIGLFEVENSANTATHTMYTSTVQTTDATVTQATAIPVAVDEVYSVEVDVVARENATGADRAQYKLAGLFYRNTGGDVTQQGSTTSLSTIESDGTWDCNLTADTENQQIDIDVTGKAATTIDWVATIKFTLVS